MVCNWLLPAAWAASGVSRCGQCGNLLRPAPTQGVQDPSPSPAVGSTALSAVVPLQVEATRAPSASLPGATEVMAMAARTDAIRMTLIRAFDVFLGGPAAASDGQAVPLPPSSALERVLSGSGVPVAAPGLEPDGQPEPPAVLAPPVAAAATHAAAAGAGPTAAPAPTDLSAPLFGPDRELALRLLQATPQQVVHFLWSRNTTGRTLLHGVDCAFQDESAATPRRQCACPAVQSIATLDRNIGLLRGYYRDIGVGSRWDPLSATGNPVASAPVSQLLAGARLLFAQRSVSRTRAPLLTQRYVDTLLSAVLASASASWARSDGPSTVSLLRFALLLSSMWSLGVRFEGAVRLRNADFSVPDGFPTVFRVHDTQAPGARESVPDEVGQFPTQPSVFLSISKTRRSPEQSVTIYFPPPPMGPRPRGAQEFPPELLSPPVIWATLRGVAESLGLVFAAGAPVVPAPPAARASRVPLSSLVSSVPIPAPKALALLREWTSRLGLGPCNLHSFHASASLFAAPDSLRVGSSGAFGARVDPDPAVAAASSAPLGYGHQGSQRSLLAMHWTQGTQQRYHGPGAVILDSPAPLTGAP